MEAGGGRDADADAQQHDVPDMQDCVGDVPDMGFCDVPDMEDFDDPCRPA